MMLQEIIYVLVYAVQFVHFGDVGIDNTSGTRRMISAYTVSVYAHCSPFLGNINAGSESL